MVYRHTDTGDGLEAMSTDRTGQPLNPFRPLEQRLRIMAHQGYQGVHAPNSPGALEAAFGVAEAVECDMYALPKEDGSEEKEIVAIHPEGYFLFVNKNGMNNTEQLPLSAAEAREITFRGERLIATLDEILDAYERKVAETGKRTEIQFELKGPGTAEAVVPALAEKVREGKLRYDDFCVTGLCYLGDRSRLEEARKLDPNVRIVFVLRGGDFSQDGFADLAEVLSFAKQINAETLTLTRRLLTPEVVSAIREAGYLVGCFHGRTSDEIEAAVALDTDYIAADFYRGPQLSDYPGVRPQGTPFFNEIQATGFYQLRDWIWELGWEYEKLRNELPHVPPTSEMYVPMVTGCDAVLRQGSACDVALRLCDGAGLSEVVVDYSEVSVPEKYLSKIDMTTGFTNAGMLPAIGSVLDAFVELWKGIQTHRGETDSSILDAFVNFKIDDLINVSEGNIEKLMTLLGSQLDPEKLELPQVLAREVLFRTGRFLGMLAFTALNPRHGSKEEYAVAISSEPFRRSKWVQNGAAQQIEAQGLRSGKICKMSWK